MSSHKNNNSQNRTTHQTSPHFHPTTFNTNVQQRAVDVPLAAPTPSPLSLHQNQPQLTNFYSTLPTPAASTDTRHQQQSQISRYPPQVATQNIADSRAIGHTDESQVASHSNPPPTPAFLGESNLSSRNKHMSIMTSAPQSQNNIATLGVSFRPVDDFLFSRRNGEEAIGVRSNRDRLGPRQQRQRASLGAGGVSLSTPMDSGPNDASLVNGTKLASVLRVPTTTNENTKLRGDINDRPAQKKSRPPPSQWSLLRRRLVIICEKAKAAVVNPSLPAITTLFAVVAVIVATLCAIVISETLFRKSMEDFATKTAQSISTGTAMDVTHFLQHSVRSADMLQFGTLMADRWIPSDEERDMSAVQPPLREIPANLWERYDVFDHLNGTQHMQMMTYRKFYFTQLAGIMRASNFRYQAVSAAFQDGAACTVNSDLYASQKTAVLWGTDGFMRSYPNGTARNRLARFFTYDDNGHQIDRTGYYNNSYDPRTRSWYRDTPNKKYTKTWTNFTLTVYPTRPVISLTAPLWNTTTQIGKLSFSLELSALSKMLRRTRTIDGSKMFLLSHGFVLGASITPPLNKKSNKTAVNSTSIPTSSPVNVTYSVDDVDFGDQVFEATAVPRGYVLTEADLELGCQIAEEEEGKILSTTKFCPHTIDSYGYQPLLDLRSKCGDMLISEQLSGGQGDHTMCGNAIPIPSVIENLVPTVKEVSSGGDDYYAVSVPIVVSCSNNMDWVLVTLIPKDQITGVFSHVRSIVIGVTIAIIATIIVTIIIVSRLTLRSLTDIAELMTAAAYFRDFDEDAMALDDEGISSSSISGTTTTTTASNNKRLAFRKLARNNVDHTDSSEDDGAAEQQGHNFHDINKNFKSDAAPRKSERTSKECSKKATKKAEKQRQEKLAAIEKLRNQLADRTESRFAEVRAIQRAYWAMSEELNTLKAYIPEHLKLEIVAIHRNRLLSGEQHSSNDTTAASDRNLSRASSSPTVTPMTDLLGATQYKVHMTNNSHRNQNFIPHSTTIHSNSLLKSNSTPIGPTVSSALLPDPKSLSNVHLGGNPSVHQLNHFNEHRKHKVLADIKVTSVANTPFHHAFEALGAGFDNSSDQRHDLSKIKGSTATTHRRRALSDFDGVDPRVEMSAMPALSALPPDPSMSTVGSAGICHDVSTTSNNQEISAFSSPGYGDEGKVIAALRRLSSGDIGSGDNECAPKTASSFNTDASIGMGVGMTSQKASHNQSAAKYHAVVGGNKMLEGGKMLNSPLVRQTTEKHDTPLGAMVSPSTDSAVSPFGGSFPISMALAPSSAKLIEPNTTNNNNNNTTHKSSAKGDTHQKLMALPSPISLKHPTSQLLSPVEDSSAADRSMLALPMPYQINSNGKWSLPGSVREGGIGHLGELGHKRKNSEQADGISLPGGSIDNFSTLAAKAVKGKSDQPPVFFVDSSLVDRDITIVHMNIIHFHMYARRQHPMTLSTEYAEFITYIKGEVKRFGGVLESFFGDKFWISFNATSKCDHHAIAASYFAYHVTTVINNNALRYLAERAPRADGTTVPKTDLTPGDPRFAVCRYGANCGVATGRAFVGPLGNNEIKRHSIISNALSEAAALERLSLRYPGVNAMIGGDMIPAIEGYCQYLLVDATLLPGSQGKRRRVACLKGPMLAPSADPNVVRRWLIKRKPKAMTKLLNTQQKLLQEKQQQQQLATQSQFHPSQRFSLSGPSMATELSKVQHPSTTCASPSLLSHVTIFAYDVEEVVTIRNPSDDIGNKSSDSNSYSNSNGSGRQTSSNIKVNEGKGTNGKSIRGVTTENNPNADVIREYSVLLTVPSINKYKTLNESFNAVLEGQNSVAQQLLYTVASEIQSPDISTAETDSEFTERKAIMDFMAQLVQAFLTNGIEGRSYKSSLGDRYMPFSHTLAVSSSLRIEF